MKKYLKTPKNANTNQTVFIYEGDVCMYVYRKQLIQKCMVKRRRDSANK